MPDTYTFIQNAIFNFFFTNIFGYLMRTLIETINKKTIVYFIKTYDDSADFIINLGKSKYGYDIICKTVKRTRIIFWNAGNKTINGNDFASKEKLSISLNKEIKIFRISLIPLNELNCVTLKKNKNNVINIDYEFLGKNDFFVINILHDIEDLNNIKINGYNKDYGKISKGNFNIKIIKVLYNIKKNKKLHPTQNIVFV